MTDNADRIKESINVPQLWERLGYGPAPRVGLHHSPFRNDNHKSFSIYDDGNRWKDQSSDQYGTVIDFYMVHAGLYDDKEGRVAAIEALMAICDLKDTDYTPLTPPKTKRRQVFQEAAAEPKRESQEPFDVYKDRCLLEFGNVSFQVDLQRFAARKSLDMRWVSQQNVAGFLGNDNGRMVYFYENGAKRRGDWDSSRGDRWIYGGQKGNLWRSELLQRSFVDSVYLFEGETDTLSIITAFGFRKNIAECGIPGASWSPDPVMAYSIGQDRRVFLCMDHDKPNPHTGKRAGHESMLRISGAITEACSRTEIFGLSWANMREAGVDVQLDLKQDVGAVLCNMGKSFLENKFDSCFKSL